MPFQPLTDYRNYEHVLNAIPCCVHPLNGTLYGCAIEKRGGVQQDLSIYRIRRNSTVVELVKRYRGGVDAVSQFALGGCLLLQDGSLEVWASLVPKEAPTVTKTGFQGMRNRLLNIDEPWTMESRPAGLSGVTQDEPGAIEVRGGESYAYLDLSTSTDVDFGARFIRVPGGARLEIKGVLTVITDKGMTTL